MPADVKIVADKITKITTDYYKALAKVKSAKEMAAVINKYAAEPEKIAPQVKKIEEKYGSMEDDSDEDEDLPEDLAEFESFMAEQMNNSDIGAGFENLAKYYTDPDVQKALERLAKVSESMGMSDDDTVITAGWPNPEKASCPGIMPVIVTIKRAMSATKSWRILPHAKRKRAIISVKNTIGRFINFSPAI
jgi:hypothetical protein